MIVHREVSQRVSRTDALRRLAQLAREGNASELLLEAGALEQAALDTLHPHEDACSPLVERLRKGVLEAAAAHLAGEPSRKERHLRRAAALLLRDEDSLPPVLHVHPPRGYCYHAVDPDAWTQAARDYRRAAGPRAADAVVLGVRSIGTSLSAVVAAASGATTSWTLRLRGPREEPRVQAERELEGRIAGAVRRGADLLVVDQPPGPDARRFAAVAAWLTSLGAKPQALVLFPGPSAPWQARPLPEGLRALAGARSYLGPADDPRPRRIAEARGWGDLVDISKGRWRSTIRRGDTLPAWEAGERSKHLARGGGRLWQIRYVGPGAWGRAVIARAERLAEAGVGPEPEEGAQGFIVLPWVRGLPARRGRQAPPDLLAYAARYLATRGQAFRTGTAVRLEAFAHLLDENGRAAGLAGPALSRALRRMRRLPEREAVVADARLRPWEWLRTADGHLKVDALDHGDTFRAPGPCDPAWDLAGLAIELRLDDGENGEMVRRCALRWGEQERHLAQAVEAYRPVYAATCWAEATMATGSRIPPDPLHAGEIRFYKRALARELRVTPVRRPRRRVQRVAAGAADGAADPPGL